MSSQKNYLRNTWLKIRNIIPKKSLKEVTYILERLRIELIRRKYSHSKLYPNSRNFADGLNSYLKEKSLPEKQQEIKYLSYFISQDDNHQDYDLLLKHFVPDQKLTYKNAKFIGQGKGSSSLDTYRRIEIGKNQLFEKVYFNSFKDLEILKFLEEFIFPLFENQLKVPRLKKLYSGELISIVYFEYLNLIKILPPEEEKSLIEVSHLLHKISLENDDFLATLGFFKQLSDFRQHYQYLKNSKLSKDYLETHEINALSFEQAAESSKRILTHSDLHVGNIFQNMVLIDWDHFGFYPIGFDPAFLYFRLLENNQIKETDPSKWIMDNYFRLIEPKDWEDFERNFYYFLWVFSIKRLEKKQIYNSEDLINKLINKLKSYKI